MFMAQELSSVLTSTATWEVQELNSSLLGPAGSVVAKYWPNLNSWSKFNSDLYNDQNTSVSALIHLVWNQGLKLAKIETNPKKKKGNLVPVNHVVIAELQLLIQMKKNAEHCRSKWFSFGSQSEKVTKVSRQGEDCYGVKRPGRSIAIREQLNWAEIRPAAPVTAARPCWARASTWCCSWPLSIRLTSDRTSRKALCANPPMHRAIPKVRPIVFF